MAIKFTHNTASKQLTSHQQYSSSNHKAIASFMPRNINYHPIKTSLLALVMSTGLSACSNLPTDNAASKTSSTTIVKPASTQFDADKSRHEYQLANGLKVIIKEDHRSPVVMTQIWYAVGSNDEPEDKGGISHLLEHMMFKGTDKVSGSDFDRIIAKFGGQHNAFTSYDYTGYYEMFPANRLELALELEADRMSNLSFHSAQFQKEFNQERNVVMEERRQRTDDNPLARSFEKFNKMALSTSPKGESIIGPMDEIANITIEELEHWYKTWYAPNNATLVIVGDVTPEDTLKKVEHYFGNIERKLLPKRPSVTQNGWRGYQQQTITEAVNVPTLLMAFNVPTLSSLRTANLSEKEAYDLLMLQFLMDGGYAARFEKSLIREQSLLASVMSHYSLYERGDGLFMIQATPREGISLSQAQAAIIEQIDKFKTETISDEELQRARNNVVKGFVFSQDSMSGQANMIGNMQVRGLDDRLVNKLSTELATINSDDINAIAKKYLRKNNLTVMHIEPASNNVTNAQ